MSPKKTTGKAAAASQKSMRTITAAGCDELDRLMSYAYGLSKLCGGTTSEFDQKVTLPRCELKEIFETISERVLIIFDSVHSTGSSAAGGAQ